MILKNIQFTVVVPERLSDSQYLDILAAVKDDRLIKQVIKEGRECTSCGILKRSDNETEVVLNFE